MEWIPIVIIAGLAIIYVVLTFLNGKVKEPEGCEERRAEMCEICKLADVCKSKKEVR